ncbi:MAG: tRNA/rRNA methyltransferase [Cytophagales bacterium]|nr:tRNA/rRNA methyltransferase [Cytophagales bacterium]
MSLSFILVEPAVPENIGAAARAIKTMGFHELRLVNPSDHLADKAVWLAHGSKDVLDKATLFNSFRDSIADLDFIIGTTAKRRSAKYDYYTPEEALKIVEKKGDTISKVGIVFGREESGLKNEELALCDIASSIPLSNPYPSINLGQCVMLYAYVFSVVRSKSEAQGAGGSERLYLELKAGTRQILDKLDFSDDSILYHRIMERIATVNEDDARLFLSYAKKFNRKFE